MIFLRASAAFRPVAGLSDKGEADKARARRFKKSFSDLASDEKAYAKAQYKWLANSHARGRKSIKKFLEQVKTDWLEGDEEGSAWSDYRKHDSGDFDGLGEEEAAE